MNDCAAIHDLVARSVVTERPNLALQTAPDGTVTILFSDIVSSTEINAHVGDARWMELLHEHNEIVRREKAFHRGYEVKTIRRCVHACLPKRARCSSLRYRYSARFRSEEQGS
jgi:class 3 adenylate cyclase